MVESKLVMMSFARRKFIPEKIILSILTTVAMIADKIINPKDAWCKNSVMVYLKVRAKGHTDETGGTYRVSWNSTAWCTGIDRGSDA